MGMARSSWEKGSVPGVRKAARMKTSRIAYRRLWARKPGLRRPTRAMKETITGNWKRNPKGRVRYRTKLTKLLVEIIASSSGLAKLKKKARVVGRTRKKAKAAPPAKRRLARGTTQ